MNTVADWRENCDVAVLAMMMDNPKAGLSAGIPISTGAVSALKGVPVRHDVASIREIDIE